MRDVAVDAAVEAVPLLVLEEVAPAAGLPRAHVAPGGSEHHLTGSDEFESTMGSDARRRVDEFANPCSGSV